MPNHLKAVLTVVVLLVGAATFYFEDARGAADVKWVAAALAALMVFAIWLFPEARQRKDDGGRRG